MSHKFRTPLAEYLFGLSLEGLHDEEMGDVADLGWYALFDLRLDNDSVTKDVSYAVLSIDSDGFVEATPYAGFDAFLEWDRMCDMYEEFGSGDI